jgi:hypothetical protein
MYVSSQNHPKKAGNAVKYAANILEEELKNKVAEDFFSKFDHTAIMGKIDFAVKPKNPEPNLWGDICFLWAEAKKSTAKIEESLAQLVLTIGNERKKPSFSKYPPPNFLGCFDRVKMAFVPYNELLPIFNINDFNWKVTPSDHTSKEFKLILNRIKALMDGKDIYIFNFDKDEKELKKFIHDNFIALKGETSKLQINKNNFIWVYHRWLEEVKPSIDVDWEKAKKIGIIDGYFYLADLLSEGNKTLLEKLFVLLKTNYYELDRKFTEAGFWNSSQADFKDEQKKHTRFWAKYERPPKKEFWKYIIDRQDLLVPQDIRERKGSFYTPKIWVELSQQYIADTLGEDWQDEYHIWDCAAGTGNLLAGLTNKQNLWASDIDRANVDVMKTIGLLYENQVFKFDFLNDPFTKLPKELQGIINDKAKSKRLIIYINPPYAEATSTATRVGTKENKTGVATENKIHAKYADTLGKAINELYTQFLIRIYKEIPHCKIANFSTLKALCSPNFVDFRYNFQAKLERLFVVPADTFDNVNGQFPIGFHIWDTSKKALFEEIKADVFDEDGDFIGVKTVHSYNNLKNINDWVLDVLDEKNKIGYMRCGGSDFQNQNIVFIGSKIVTSSDRKDRKYRSTLNIDANNLIKACIYFAVRHCIPADWLNDRDMFLYPTDGWKTDTVFQNDCLAYTLFHSQNKISATLGTNHWIPFTEEEVNTRKSFDSHFMLSFIGGKIIQNGYSDLFEQNGDKWCIKRKFSIEAKAVFDAGRKLWRYYHEQRRSKVNASLYDIREHFQGRDEKGKMNNKSENETYNELIGKLREKLKVLAKKIEPNVYKYGFLKA